MSAPVNSDGLTMAVWLRLVDLVLLGKVGVTHADLADFPIYDLWVDSVPPAEAAETVAVEWNDLNKKVLQRCYVHTFVTIDKCGCPPDPTLPPDGDTDA